jgi:hypothetical protein
MSDSTIDVGRQIARAFGNLRFQTGSSRQKRMSMDPRTGELYTSADAARNAGVTDPVEITGTEAAIEEIRKAVVARAARKKLKAKRKAAKASRKANRG